MESRIQQDFNITFKKLLSVFKFPLEYNRLRRLLWETIYNLLPLTSIKTTHIFIDSFNEILNNENTDKRIKNWVNEIIKKEKEKDYEIKNGFKIKFSNDLYKPFYNPLTEKIYTKYETEEAINNFKKKLIDNLEDIALSIGYKIKLLNIHFSYNDDGYLKEIHIFIDEQYISESTDI